MRTRLTALLLVLLMVSGVAFSEAETVKVEEISAAMGESKVCLMAGQPHRLAQVQPRQDLPQGLLRIVPAAGRDGAFGHPVFFHQPYPQTALRLFCRHSKTSFCFFSSKRPCPNGIPGTACAQCSASPSAATCSLDGE